jgi:hypothetical protein
MLKKIMITTMVLMLGSVPMAFGLDTTTVLPATSDTFKYNLSSLVTCLYDTDTNNVQYVLACKHQSGTRVIGVSNATSKVYFKEDNTTAYIGLGLNVSGAPASDCSGLTAGLTDPGFVTAVFKPL